MRRVPAAGLVLLLAGSMLWVASPARACSCALDRDTSFERSTVVFVGVLDRIDDPAADRIIKSGADPLTGFFSVEQVQKGTAGPVVAVRGMRGSDACGLDMKVGERYQIFGSDAGGLVQTSICNGSGVIGHRAPWSPSATSIAKRFFDDTWRPLAGGAVAVAAGLITFFGMRRLKHADARS